MLWRCDLLPQFEKYQDEILEAIQGVLSSGRYTLAENCHAFETEFSKYIGNAHGIGVANGTDAAILSYKALGIGPGDEIITTPFSAIPTLSAIVATGATPVFADVDPETYLIDINKVADRVTSRTKALAPVHLFGNVVDIEALKQKVPHIPIVEDACQAHGSTIRGRKAGSLGDFGNFSFYPTKNLGGYGDGGFITTDSPEQAENLRLIRMYGMVNKDEIIRHGVNSRLDELQAAILRVKLKYLEDMNKTRAKIVETYKSELQNYDIHFQKIEEDIVSNYHVLCATVPGKRDQMSQFLEGQNIQTNIYYQFPFHLQKATADLGYKKGDFPKTEKLCQEIIALPLYPELSEEDLNTTITQIKKFFDS